MKSNIVIKVENLSKVYTLREPREDEEGNVVYEHKALKNVSFEIKKGESVGIIGPNGSGKSTLLKILAGIVKPDSGGVIIRGKIASILDVGAGFHPELSGRENVFLNGQIHGFAKKEIEKRLGEIVAFSGVEKFIDEPVKNYSNGMYLRLAFSIIVHLDFDVYLFDEVLSVGDAEFQNSIRQLIYELKEKYKKTMLLISHNAWELIDVDRILYVEKGDYVTNLSKKEALNRYFSKDKIIDYIMDNPLLFAKNKKWSSDEVFGSFTFNFISNSELKNHVEFFSEEIINFSIKFYNLRQKVSLGLAVVNNLNNVILETGPITSGIILVSSELIELISFFPKDIFNEGEFTIDLILYNERLVIYFQENVAAFFVKDRLGNEMSKHLWSGIRPILEWEMNVDGK